MKKKLKIKFLGTSSGDKIPRVDDNCDCPQCRSSDKKDKRMRSAILVNCKILVDAGPDIALQLNPTQIKNLEAVLITHDHQDHVGGLKDLLKIDKNVRIIRLQSGAHFKLLGIDFHAFKVRHSNMVPTVGVEIDKMVYIPDFADLDLASQYLNEAKIAVLDGSVWGRNFGGHLSINETIAITKPLKNLEQIYFTHNGHTRKPHAEMEPLVQKIGDERYHLAFDGLELEI